MHNCRDLQRRIWDAIETGNVAPDLQQSLDGCPECLRELSLARSAMRGFDAIRSVRTPVVAYLPASKKIGLQGWMRMPLAAGAAALLIIALVSMHPYWAPHRSGTESIPQSPIPAKPREIVMEPAPVQEKAVPLEDKAVLPQERSPLPAKGRELQRRPSQAPTPNRPAIATPRPVKEQPPGSEAGFQVEYRVDGSADMQAVIVKSEGGCFMKTVPDIRTAQYVERRSRPGELAYAEVNL